jgi:hypothetical protein
VATVTGVSDGTTVGTGSFIADSMAFAVFGTKLPSTSSSVFVDVSTGVYTTTDTFIAAYLSKLHPISPAVTGSTGYLVLQLGINDIVTLESDSAAYVENNYLTIWAMAHADGWKILQTSLIPYGTDQGQLSTINEVNLWLRGRSPQDAVTNSQNWDIFDDVAQILPTDTDAAVFMQTGSPNPHHLNDSGNNLLAASVAQGLSSPLSSLYSLNADYNFGLNWALINGGTLTNQGLIVGNNASISPIGNGSIAATSLDGVTVSGTPTPGQSVIASGSTSAVWGYVPCGYNDIPCTDAANSWFGTQTYTTSGPASPAVIEKGSAGAISSVFVQSAFVTTGSPYTLSFTSPVTAGDTLLVFETSDYGTTITDTLGNTFTGVPGCGCYYSFSTAMAYSATGGADTITVTPSSSQSFNVLIAEYRGPLSVSPLDGTPAKTDNYFGTGSGGATTVGPITTVANGDLIITATSRVTSLGAPSVAGFTARDSTDGINLYDTIQVSAGNQSAAWNWATGYGRSVGTLFALKAQTLSGQTADLHQYESAAGALVGAVNAYGQIQLPTASNLPTNTPVDSGVALAADTTCTSLLAVYTGSAWECLPSNPGTVTSVGLTMPGVIFNSTVPGSPVTTSSTLAPTLATQTANTVLAGPATGSPATPTFRALVSADIPNNAASTTGTAANLSGTPALPNGTTATTQSVADNSTNLETTAGTLAKITAKTLSLNVPAWLQNLGDGSDGNNLTASGGMTGDLYYNNFTVPYGNTVTSSAYQGSLTIHAKGTCTIAGLITSTNNNYISNGLYGGSSGATGGGTSAGSAGKSTLGPPGMSSYVWGGITIGAVGQAGGGSAWSDQALTGGALTEWARVVATAGGATDGQFLGGAPSVAGTSSSQGSGVTLICGSIVGTDGTHTGIIDMSASPSSPPTANNTGAQAGGGGGVVLLSSQSAIATPPLVYVAGGAAAIGSAILTTPVNGTFTTATTGGSLTGSTSYYYTVVAHKGPNGSTAQSTETSLATGAGTNTNTITVKWAVVPGAQSYDICGRTTGSEQLIATILNNGAGNNPLATQYVDTGSITPSGTCSTTNTTSGWFTTPQALSYGGTCTSPAKLLLGVTSGALNGTATVIQAGAGCGTGTGVQWSVLGAGGTLGTGTVNPTWSGGSVVSATTTPGTSSGYTPVNYTVSGDGGDGSPGVTATFQGW